MVQILFASLAIIGKIVLRDFPAASLVLFRVVGAAAVLLLVNLLWTRRWVRNRKDLLGLALLGLFGVVLNQTLFLVGLSHTTAINATILVTTIPIFTVLCSVLSHREPPSALNFGGIAVSGLGAIYLIGPDRLSLAPRLALGNLLIVVAMCMAGVTMRPWARVILATVAIECALSMGVFAYVAWDLQHRHGVSVALSGLWIVAYPAGGVLYSILSGTLVARLGERGLALWGGLLIGAGYLCLLLAPAAIVVLPGLLAVGIGFAMLHNTLQVNATQMAPEARGTAVSLFAFCLFPSQSAGVAAVGQLIDARGIAPAYLAATLGLPLLALEFRRRLGKKLGAGDA